VISLGTVLIVAQFLLLDPIAAAAIYGTTFPAYMNAPLRRIEETQGDASYPLMIFSHGVGCSRLMYSSFCGEMASRGRIVCAIEHRDGTSPSSTIVTEDGVSKKLDFLSWKDLYWPNLDPQPENDTTLRHEQIKMRLAEIKEVVLAVERITSGEKIVRTRVQATDKVKLPDEDSFDWDRWKGSIDSKRVVMSGHSLGGSAAVSLLIYVVVLEVDTL
jgi:platelet-activating factor acetylhydrolase